MIIIGTRTIKEETSITHIDIRSPDSLLLNPKYFLKKLIIFPIHTTGCILAGNSPINKSNANANNNIVSSM